MRGVFRFFHAAQIPAHSYSPREIKASISGFGNASKQQMQQMVASSLDYPTIPNPSDAADALAVALFATHVARARERMAAATGIRTGGIAIGRAIRSGAHVPGS